ncbi:MAG: hypothetical protein U0T74_04725 [Chitinophagales bacterium]
MKELWAIKHSYLKHENELHENGYLKRAGVYAEFAKIVCISIGYFNQNKEKLQQELSELNHSTEMMKNAAYRIHQSY